MTDYTSSWSDDAYNAADENDQTLSVFFLFFMVLLAIVLLLGRGLHNRPYLNSYLSEPAMVLIVSACFSLLVKFYLTTSSSDQQDKKYMDDYYAYDDANKQQGDDNYDIEIDTDKLQRFLLTFSEDVFFMVFLPPILFNSGYELKRELFFRHIKPIVSFAVFGTAFSGIMTGLILYGYSNLGWTGEVHPNLWELLTFGSLITATDTVSVLAVLNAKQVNPHLFSLVFGESAFNDAVSIVMFQSFSHLVRLGGNVNMHSLYDQVRHFAMEFLLDVLACPLLGMSMAFLAAMLFKNVEFHGTPVLELSLYLLMIYIPFILAEVLGMSGIITIFVTGMFARRYIEPNVTKETKHNAEVIFNLVAYLAETCIFLNLGLSVCGFTGSFHIKFIICAFVASLIGRALSIYPISFLYNFYLTERVAFPPSLYDCHKATVDVVASDFTNNIEMCGSALQCNPVFRDAMNTSIEEKPNISLESLDVSTFTEMSGNDGVPVETGVPVDTGSPIRMMRRTAARNRDRVIPVNFMHFLWFAGLRGAVAYACARDFPDVYGNKNEIVAATMVIVFFSIIVMGACCEPLLHALNIRMGVDNDEYMKEWRNRRQLNSKFHRFEKKYIYNVVVRSKPEADMIDDYPLMVEKGEGSFNLPGVEGAWIEQSYSGTERATTAISIARTLTGSSQYFD